MAKILIVGFRGKERSTIIEVDDSFENELLGKKIKSLLSHHSKLVIDRAKYTRIP